MHPLKNELASSESVLYVFYDFETTQDTKLNYKMRVQVPKLVCLQQVSSKCESISDINHDCIQCGKRMHTFREEPVGDMSSYL